MVEHRLWSHTISDPAQERMRMRAIVRLQTLLPLGAKKVTQIAPIPAATQQLRKGMRARQELHHLRVLNDEARSCHAMKWR